MNGLPRYRVKDGKHEVQAAMINAVRERRADEGHPGTEDESRILDVKFPDARHGAASCAAALHVSGEFVAKHRPSPGMYYLIDDHGNASCLTAGTFERNHDQIAEKQAPPATATKEKKSAPTKTKKKK